MTHLAAVDRIVEYGEGFEQRGAAISIRHALSQLAEEIGLPIGPMQLTQVDVFDPDSLQVHSESRLDAAPLEPCLTVTQIG